MIDRLGIRGGFYLAIAYPPYSIAGEDTPLNAALDAIIHALIVEGAQFLYLIVLPLCLVVFVILYNKAWHPLITKVSRAIHVPLRRWMLAAKLNRIYMKGDLQKLRRNHRDNALNQARSNDGKAKMAGLAQLAEFPDEETILELIRIVASETDSAFRRMEIETLCKMRENLEHG